MHLFILFSVLITLVAIFSYFNVRVLKMASGISLMFMGSLLSLGIIVVGWYSPEFVADMREQILVIDFSEFLLGILLSFLLFAGSLHVKVNEIREAALSIISFATIGTLISTFVMGTAVFYLLPVFGIEVPYVACLLFGALISPTDPIAVIGILRKANLSRDIEVKITGESLFNDGIGVVVFAAIMQISLTGIENLSALSVAGLFAREALGGIAAGLVIGYVGYKMMKSIDHFTTEILISLAMVMGGYSLCHYLHVSGPLAMVIAGLYTGNKARRLAMSDITRDYLEKFWEVTDEILNGVLFMLIGLELVIVQFKFDYVIIGLIAAVLLVISRYISLWIPAFCFRFKSSLEDKTLQIMTWGGLRGGISIALALSLPNDENKNVFVAITFVIVLFSILIQGMTIGRVIQLLTNNKR